MSTSGEMSIEKNGRRENNFQNKCVSSQNRRSKKRRGRHHSGYTYLPSGETVPAGLVRAERAAILHGDNFTGKPHKIPLMSYLRFSTRNAGKSFQTFKTDWPSKTDETNETKRMQLSLRTD